MVDRIAIGGLLPGAGAGAQDGVAAGILVLPIDEHAMTGILPVSMTGAPRRVLDVWV